MISVYHPHHDGSSLYVGDEPRDVGQHIQVRVWVPHQPDGSAGARTVILRSVKDGEPLVVPAVLVRRDDGGAWWQANLELANPLTSYRFLVTRGRDDFRWLNANGVHARDVTDTGDFKISTEHALPDWVLDQIGYQIFPDRFERSTHSGLPQSLPTWAIEADWSDAVIAAGDGVAEQIYGGTLDGIAARLSHVQALGATTLYLTPVFEARSNHRYDAVSFDRVDSLLGGDAALSRLIDAAHDGGIRVIGDLTTNHTGVEHEWFVAANSAPDAPERQFYAFDDDGYVSWLGVPSLPKLDHSSAELARRLYLGDASVVAKWLVRGLDGWRIDVANMTGRLGRADLAHVVARAIRQTMSKSRPDSWLLAEHGHDAALDLRGDGWHGTMDYTGFTRPLWCWLNGGSPAGPGLPHGLDYLGLPIDVPVLSGDAVVATMREVHAAMGWSPLVASTMHLDSHDVPRFRTVTGGGTDGWVDGAGVGRDRHLVGLAIQMTMPGVPVVFMGDEIGLTGVNGEHARTPFPWDRSSEWDHLTLAAYQLWIALRRDHVSLRRGGLRWLQAGPDSLTYAREHAEETIVVHVARAPHDPVRLPLRALSGDARQLTLLAGLTAAPASNDANTNLGPVVTLPHYGPSASAYLVT